MQRVPERQEPENELLSGRTHEASLASAASFDSWRSCGSLSPDGTPAKLHERGATPVGEVVQYAPLGLLPLLRPDARQRFFARLLQLLVADGLTGQALGFGSCGLLRSDFALLGALGALLG